MVLKNALVINLDGELLTTALKAWEELRQSFAIKYISSRSTCPHIALEYDFEILNQRRFKLQFLEFCKTKSSFEIMGRGLGIFIVESPVVYIRWKKNKNIIRLKNDLSNFLKLMKKEKTIKDYSVDEDWEPKTTLAYNDSDYVNLEGIIRLLRGNDFTDLMNVRSISLYEYSVELGENELGEFRLGLF